MNDIKQNTLYSTQQVLNQTKSFLEFKTMSTKNILDIVSLNDVLREILDRKLEDYQTDVGLWIIDSQTLDRVLFSTSTNPDISRIQVYMEEGPASFLQSDTYLLLSEYKDSVWYDKFTITENKTQWFLNKEFAKEGAVEYISAMRSIPSNKNIQQSIGFIKMDIRKNVFQTLINQAVFTESSVAALINSDNQVLCVSDNAKNKTDVLAYIANNLDGMQQNHFKTLKVNNKSVSGYARNLKNRLDSIDDYSRPRYCRNYK